MEKKGEVKIEGDGQTFRRLGASVLKWSTRGELLRADAMANGCWKTTAMDGEAFVSDLNHDRRLHQHLCVLHPFALISGPAAHHEQVSRFGKGHRAVPDRRPVALARRPRMFTTLLVHTGKKLEEHDYAMDISARAAHHRTGRGSKGRSVD
jgi:hypothetical protein